VKRLRQRPLFIASFGIQRPNHPSLACSFLSATFIISSTKGAMEIKNQSQYDLGFCRRPAAITADWNGRLSRPLKPLFSLPNSAGYQFVFSHSL
jgi:hypothetical protein